jgi:glycosyltransferase involved in cell wall biosynthesis
MEMLELMSMKVLQIGKFFAPHHGGMESHLQHLCPGLADKVDLDVVVFGEPDAEFTERFGFRLHRVKTQAVVASAPISFGLAARIASIPADIVHIHHPNPMAILAYLLSGHPGRLVVTYHSDIVRQRLLGRVLAPLHEKAWRRTWCFMVASPDYIESSPVLSRYRERTTVLPHGIDLEALPQPDAASVAAVKIRFPGPIVLAVGRLVGYKGFEYLVSAFALLTKLPRTPHLILIGVGPLKDQLLSQIASLGLNDVIHLLDRVDDVSPYYVAADVFVLSSTERSEAYGFVQVEAMAYATAVVNTRLQSGVPFVSRDGETGFTVPPGDAGSLARAITTLLTDDELRMRFAHAARERAYGEFSAQKMVDRTFEAYEEVLKAKSMAPLHAAHTP